MSIEDLYRAYSLPVYRFLLKLTGSAQEAEELLQETFYQALLHVDRFEGRCSPFTWLCQIGKNAWFAQAKKRQRFVPLDEEAQTRAGTACSAEEEAMQRRREQELREAVAGLPEPYREVVALHIYGGLPLNDIAESFGKAESWGRVTWYRAKRMLAGQVERDG